MNEIYAAVIDAAMAQDRVYFDEHPDEKVYTRKAFAGEFAPAVYLRKERWVRVRVVGPGLRTRELL